MKEILYRTAVETDYPAILQFQQKYFEVGRNMEILDWIINQNPAGKAIYMLAWDGEMLIGTQCIMPYWLRNSKGQLILTGKSEDTCVHPAYRGKHIFQQMYEEVNRIAKNAGIRYIWGYTSAVSPFKKVGFTIGPAYKMAVAAKDIKMGYLALREKGRLLRNLKWMAFLWKNYLGVKLNSYMDVRIENGRNIETELVRLNRNASVSVGFTKEYLSWRVWNNPYYKKVFCLTYRERGKLKGYLLFHVIDKMAFVIHHCLDEGIEFKKASLVLAAFVHKIWTKGVSVIKNWIIELKEAQETAHKNWKDAGFGLIQSGSHFVWLSVVEDGDFRWQDLRLTRISSLGST